MKTLIATLFICTLIVTNCTIDKTETSSNEFVVKKFEDNSISCELVITEILGKELNAQLNILNKSEHKVKINLNDFNFVAGKHIAEISKSWKIPNYDKMTKIEKEHARMEIRKENRENAISRNWFSTITLGSRKTIQKEINLKFDGEVDVEEVIFYFDGIYKKFLTT